MEKFFTENLLLNIGGMGLAAIMMIGLIIGIKILVGVIKKQNEEANARQSEFNKAMTNHLEHTYQSEMARAESDKALAAALGKFSEQLDNFVK